MQIIRYLVEEVKVNIHHEEHQKRNVIYLGAFEGNLEVVEYLYKKGCNINKQSSLGRTPLSKACYLGRIHVVKYLLSIKADMTIKDVKDRTPLHNAAWGREGGRDGKKRGDQLVDDSPECVQLLLNAGHSIDPPDCDGFTPFFSSVSSNGIRSFRLLLKRGANVNHLTNKGENACLIAAKYGHLEILKCLVEDYKCDINLRDSYGMSALEAAAIYDNDTPIQQHEYMLQQEFAKVDKLDQPNKCFEYLMQRVFASDNDKQRTFTFSNFIYATLFYKRQDYLVYLIRNKNIQKSLREVFVYEPKIELLETCMSLTNRNLVEFIEWMKPQLSDSQWQLLINKLLAKERLVVLKNIIKFNNVPVKLNGLQQHIKEGLDQDLLWTLLQIDSDCTASVDRLTTLLSTLITQRRTQTLIRILTTPETVEATKAGILAWSKKTFAQIVTERTEDKLSLIQYCEVNHFRDLSKLLENLAEECLKTNKQQLLGFTIPEYSVEVQHRWKPQVIVQQIQPVPLVQLLTKRQRQFIAMFKEIKEKTAFIQQQKRKRPIVLVDNLTTLNELAAVIDNYGLWGIDVEYYSEDHSFICTIQMSNIDCTYVVDALKLRSQISILCKVFESANKIKVFHSCDNDIRWLCEDFSFKTVNIFDTCKTYMTLTGDKISISLKKLAQTTLQYNIDKDFQTADWRIRPLLREMIDYARMDAEILLYLFAEQTAQASSKGLIKQIEAQCFRERKLNLRGKRLQIKMK